MHKLVSIITPSHNYGHFISRLLDSVMNQTYENIEMFVIDDGSTDNTQDIVKPYIEKFAKSGKNLNCIYQDNAGVPGAINTGLRKISGEYLVFPDADDWYNTNTAIADMIEVFETSISNIGAVRGLQYLRDENLRIIDRKGDPKRSYPVNLAEHLLFNNEDYWWWASGSIMIKTEYLFYYYPKKEIYYRDSSGQNIRFGQNFQLLFPILYDFECFTMTKYIHNVLVHRNSDSRKKLSYAEEIKRREQIHDVRISVLDLPQNMINEEKNRLSRIVSLKTDASRFVMAFKFMQKKDCSMYYNKILSEDRIEAQEYRWRYLFSQMALGFKAYKLYVLSRSVVNYFKRYYWVKNERRKEKRL